MKKRSGAGIFITGTDTGVGKTFVGTGIAKVLLSMGVNVGVMKPVETGCQKKGGELIPQDAGKLLIAAGADDPLDLVNPYRFQPPVAPMVAAEKEGSTVETARIMDDFRKLRARRDFLIVEGAGGIMVPLSPKRSYLDLAESMGLPVLIVARPGLGTINHTVLTVTALQSRNIPLSGIVMNFRMRPENGIAERTNPAVIERITGLPVFMLPHGCGSRAFSRLARQLSLFH